VQQLDRETVDRVSSVLEAAGVAVERATASTGHAQVQAEAGVEARADFPIADVAAALARVHAIKPPHPELTCLPVPLLPPARALVAQLRSVLDAAAEPRPALEYILAWLDDHAPPARALALVHGRLEVSKVSRGAGQPVVFGDWDSAHWGDPDADVASLARSLRRATGSDAAERLVEEYAASSGRTPSADALRYWQIMAAAGASTRAVTTGDRLRIHGEKRLALALEGLGAAGAEHEALSEILTWRGAGEGGPTWP
jgi:aminoglycoside phosphotransferase (APT) family kinase protein